jgi:glycosyltransferase involved in cell wall biosynthesis
MACGTPVVAFPNGSVPEVVVDGSTGIIVEREADLAAAIHRASALDPADCRRDVEERFSIEAMAAGYEDAYRAVARPPASRIEPALVTKQPGVPTLRS